MKTPASVGLAYDIIQEKFLYAVGEPTDITAAFYKGSCDKSLEQAQRDKHELVLEGINFKSGNRILDIGCGWGPMLEVINERRGNGIGITVSKKQHEYCQRKGLYTFLHDWKDNNLLLEKFDGIVSIGAFEHFCSPEEYIRREQETIYDEFFKFCSGHLKEKGRVFLQTMIWGRVPKYPEDFNINAPKGTDKKILGILFSLASWWPPTSLEQIVRCAEPYFNFLENINGREDYIKTFREWHLRLNSRHKGKLKANLMILYNYLTKKNSRTSIRNGLEMLKHQYFREAFISHLLDHERIFFEKR